MANELSLDQCMREPGVYYNPEEGVIIRVSKVAPLLEHSEELVAGKKGGEPVTYCVKIADDPALNDDDVQYIIRQRKL
ncbi:MAG TPA: hypothetical protein VGK02_03460 [Candidatus Aquicultor sp.]|jgi:hypothetical protein